MGVNNNCNYYTSVLFFLLCFSHLNACFYCYVPFWSYSFIDMFYWLFISREVIKMICSTAGEHSGVSVALSPILRLYYVTLISLGSGDANKQLSHQIFL